MNYKVYARLVTITILLISTPQLNNTYTQEPIPSIAPTTIAPTPINPDVAALQAQLETMRWYDQRLMTTVWGALGLVFTLAIGLALYNGWTTSRSYERDKEALRTEVISIVSTQTQKSLTTQITKLQENIQKIIESEGETINREITFKTKDINLKLDHLSLKYHKSQVEYLEHTEQYYKALLQCVDIYEVIIRISPNKTDMSYQGRVSDLVSNMVNISSKVRYITVDSLARINEILDDIPPEHREAISEIRTNLKAKREKSPDL